VRQIRPGKPLTRCCPGLKFSLCKLQRAPRREFTCVGRRIRNRYAIATGLRDPTPE
jgi:hypothetical protein